MGGQGELAGDPPIHFGFLYLQLTLASLPKSVQPWLGASLSLGPPIGEGCWQAWGHEAALACCSRTFPCLCGSRVRQALPLCPSHFVGCLLCSQLEISATF